MRERGRADHPPLMGLNWLRLMWWSVVGVAIVVAVRVGKTGNSPPTTRPRNTGKPCTGRRATVGLRETLMNKEAL